MNEDHIEVAEATASSEDDLVSVAQEVKNLKSIVESLEKGAKEAKVKLAEAKVKLAMLSGLQVIQEDDLASTSTNVGFSSEDEPSEVCNLKKVAPKKWDKLQRIFRHVNKHPTSFTEIMEKTKISRSRLNTHLTLLISMGAVERIVRGIYRKILDTLPQTVLFESGELRQSVLQAMGDGPVRLAELTKSIKVAHGASIVNVLNSLAVEKKVEKLARGIYRRKA